MQLSSVYLYPNRLDTYTNLDEWAKERYRKVYHRNVKIYRDADNKLEFNVKSSDQKAKSIAGKHFLFSIISRETQELVLSKDCTVDSTSQGKLHVIINRTELQKIEPGFYQYSILAETRNYVTNDTYTIIDRTPLYTDSQYGVDAVIEVFGGVTGEPRPSTEIAEFKYNNAENKLDDFYYSGIIYAKSHLAVPQTNHTFQLFFTNYSGRVILQGSLDIGGNPQSWTDIISTDYINTNVEYLNVVGKYNWFRFKHIPNHPGLVGQFKVRQNIYSFQYDVEIIQPGRNYSVGNTILIKGNQLFLSETPGNDLIITVMGVDLNGGITSITWTGLSQNGSQETIVGGNTQSNTGTFDKILYR